MVYKSLGLLILGLLIIGGLTSCATTEFEVGSISITPGEIVAGNTFTVEAGVSNIGENDGTFTATLELDERVFDKKKVMIAAGATKTVRFDCVVETPGVHSLRLNDSTATFTALKPADFEVTLLSVPAEAFTREAIVIEAKVINTGEVEGNYSGRLMVNGIETARKVTPIAPGAIETMSFTITVDILGTHTISLDEATSALTVFLAFPDSSLETAVREAINKPEGPIDISDLEPFTTLEARGRGISDLTGLEYCINLQVIELRDNNVSNTSPLAGLINLRDLGLWGNNISDISPLAGLTNLEVLHLHHNNISDISPLANLTFLHILHLPNNNVSDISPLAGLTYLSGLDLEGNNISDISALVGLTKLRDLSLKVNNISNLSPLVGLTDLYILNLIDNNISGISPLVENTGLGAGDIVYLEKNDLFLLEGSEDMKNIKALENRGVVVHY